MNQAERAACTPIVKVRPRVRISRALVTERLVKRRFPSGRFQRDSEWHQFLVRSARASRRAPSLTDNPSLISPDQLLFVIEKDGSMLVILFGRTVARRPRRAVRRLPVPIPTGRKAFQPVCLELSVHMSDQLVPGQVGAVVVVGVQCHDNAPDKSALFDRLPVGIADEGTGFPLPNP